MRDYNSIKYNNQCTVKKQACNVKMKGKPNKGDQLEIFTALVV